MIGALTDQELFNAVTSTAADVWGLEDTGRLHAGAVADVVVARRSSENNLDAFFSIQAKDILLVIRSGRVVMVDDTLLEKFRSETKMFSCTVGGTKKRCVIDVEGMRGEIGKHGA